MRQKRLQVIFVFISTIDCDFIGGEILKCFLSLLHIISKEEIL